MARSRWNERFFASTRGRIVGLLRRGSETVNELAEALALTDNAVRAHLAALERDGLVRQEGVRRGVGKPAHVFRLTADAEALFPKAYSFLAGELVGEMRERAGDGGLEKALREVGRRAGENAGIKGGNARERLDGTAAVLATLGSDAELRSENGHVVVEGHSCPLSNVVGQEPRTCRFLEGFLEGAVGVPVTQHCEHHPTPRCRFIVETGK